MNFTAKDNTVAMEDQFKALDLCLQRVPTGEDGVVYQ